MLGRAALGSLLLWAVIGCGHQDGPGAAHPAAPLHDTPLSGGGTAALSLCGKQGSHHFSGPRPPKDSTTPQMVVMSYGYARSRASDPGRITVRLSVAAGSEQPLTLRRPLGKEGPSVEIQGPDGVEAAAYGLPVNITSGQADGQLLVGSGPLDFEVVVPAGAVCPGRSLAGVHKSSSQPGTSSSTLVVTISDPAVARHRAAHGIDASSDLLVASWPPA